jgi:hypothetical protein
MAPCGFPRSPVWLSITMAHVLAHARVHVIPMPMPIPMPMFIRIPMLEQCKWDARGFPWETHPGHGKAAEFCGYILIFEPGPNLPLNLWFDYYFSRISDFLLGSSMCNFCHLSCWFSSLFHMSNP